MKGDPFGTNISHGHFYILDRNLVFPRKVLSSFAFNTFFQRLWATDHYQPLRIFAGHLADVNCTKFHPNSNYVATGSADRTVRLWDVLNGNCVRIFTGHKVFYTFIIPAHKVTFEIKMLKKFTRDTFCSYP